MRSRNKTTRIKLGKYRAYIRKDCRTEDFLAAIRDPDAILNRNDSQKVVDSHNRKVSIARLPIDGKVVNVYVKKYLITDRTRFLLSLLFPSRAVNSWGMAQKLELQNIAMPLHVAAIDPTILNIRSGSYLLTKEVSGAMRLKDFVLKHRNANSLVLAEKNRIIGQAALLIKEFHRRGFYHADLNIKNILITQEYDGVTQLFFLDLDRTKHISCPLFWLRDIFRTIDLRRLNNSVRDCISQRDKLRFFSLYCRGFIKGRKRKRLFLYLVNLIRRSRR